MTEINGKPTAQIMFYNGSSYTLSSGRMDYLPNPYIQDNLHLRQRSVLLEAGAQTNTVQEVKNAMEPFADILNRVLSGE